MVKKRGRREVLPRVLIDVSVEVSEFWKFDDPDESSNDSTTSLVGLSLIQSY